MTDRTFYLEQADACATAAEQATLSNQRDKFLLAERNWRALADGPRALAQNWSPAVAKRSQPNGADEKGAHSRS